MLVWRVRLWMRMSSCWCELWMRCVVEFILFFFLVLVFSGDCWALFFFDLWFGSKTCHKRGVHAMGGMAAQIPIKVRMNERHPFPLLHYSWPIIQNNKFFRTIPKPTKPPWPKSAPTNSAKSKRAMTAHGSRILTSSASHSLSSTPTCRSRTSCLWDVRTWQRWLRKICWALGALVVGSLRLGWEEMLESLWCIWRVGWEGWGVCQFIIWWWTLRRECLVSLKSCFFCCSFFFFFFLVFY